MKSKYAGKMYKIGFFEGATHYTEYWPSWPTEIVESVVTNYFSNRDDESDNPQEMDENYEPHSVLKTCLEDVVPQTAEKDVTEEVVVEINNLINYLQAVLEAQAALREE